MGRPLWFLGGTIERELGSAAVDLPHKYKSDQRGVMCAFCHRDPKDDLHHSLTPEQAAERAMFVTEKGS